MVQSHSGTVRPQLFAVHQPLRRSSTPPLWEEARHGLALTLPCPWSPEVLSSRQDDQKQSKRRTLILMFLLFFLLTPGRCPPNLLRFQAREMTSSPSPVRHAQYAAGMVTEDLSFLEGLLRGEPGITSVEVLDKSSGLLEAQSSADMVSGNGLAPLGHLELAPITLASPNRE